MTVHKTRSVHKGGMAFDAEINNHIIRMDATPAGGGEDSGPTPKPLLLASLSGCSAMNTIKILNKMRIPFKDFSVDAEAVLRDEDPRVYTSIKLTYYVTLDESNKDKFIKALDLALEKYCSLYAMLVQVVPIAYEVIYTYSTINSEKEEVENH